MIQGKVTGGNIQKDMGQDEIGPCKAEEGG